MDRQVTQALQSLTLSPRAALTPVRADPAVSGCVARLVGPSVLNRKKGLRERMDEIAWAELPTRFGIRASRGSGGRGIRQEQRASDRRPMEGLLPTSGGEVLFDHRYPPSGSIRPDRPPSEGLVGHSMVSAAPFPHLTVHCSPRNGRLRFGEVNFFRREGLGSSAPFEWDLALSLHADRPWVETAGLEASVRTDSWIP
jgi:hypothetical protein